MPLCPRAGQWEHRGRATCPATATQAAGDREGRSRLAERNEVETADIGDAAPRDETLARLLGHALGVAAPVEVEAVISGNINTIYRLRCGTRRLGVRVAANRYRFRYERALIKEVFAVAFLREAGSEPQDRAAQALLERLAATPRGGPLAHAGARTILYYDWSLDELARPFFIFEWIEGEPLWATPSEAAYHVAGADLAALHRIRFAHFYQDLLGIGRRPLSWAQAFARALARELEEASPRLPERLRRKVRRLDITGLPAPAPCLVHNDYTGGNILIGRDGGRYLIDWDNCLVEAPELDLVKMKYWTVVGPGGWLVPDQELYRAFLAGYRAHAEGGILPARLRAYEHLWLLRTFNFESARDEAREAGRGRGSWRECYPGPAAYRDYLEDL